MHYTLKMFLCTLVAMLLMLAPFALDTLPWPYMVGWFVLVCLWLNYQHRIWAWVGTPE